MLSHLLTQLLRSFGIFFRTIRAFFTRRLVGLWARLKRLTNFSRQATKVAADSLQSAAAIAKKPTSRGDYVETGRLFISKKFLLTIAIGIIVLALLIYFVAWPFILSHFFTAHFYVEDSRIETWTGRVVVYSDEEKTVPLYEGKLEDGLLQGKGKEYDGDGLLIYEGDFVDGLREGSGTEYEAGVLLYEGDFAAGVYEGEGTLYQDGVKWYKGTFADGVQSGEGTEYYENGEARYRGTFADGLYEGEGVEYNEDGEKRYEGGFSQGVYSGEGSLYPAEDQRIDATFADGEPDGAIQWYKSNKLYYDGEADGTTPSGFGTLYTRSGKTAYVGQMANGTVDGTWLVTLTAEEFREALGESSTADYDDVSNGFVISSPAIGLSALCSYQTEDSEPAVHTVYLSEPRDSSFALLPGQDNVSLSDWPTPTVSTRAYRKIDGVNTSAGTYTSAVYTLDGCRAEVLSRDDETVLVSWSLTSALTGSGAGAAGSAEAAAAEKEQEQMEAFLASLTQMNGTGAVQQSTENPYCGTGAAANALAGCTTASAASDAIDAMLTYWENAERRVALEENLTRVQELLADARNAQASGTGSADTVAELESQQTTINSQINTCITEMSKASMEATAAGAADPAQYALSELTVLFSPMTLSVDDLALVATAYAQSLAGGQDTAPGGTTGETAAEPAVDGEAITLSVQTALADLTAAYSDVQSATTAYNQAASAATSAAGSYAMGTGTKANWYNALNTREDSQASLYAALGEFTRQVNALNELTGGWVSRTQGWLTDVLVPLYNSSVQ